MAIFSKGLWGWNIWRWLAAYHIHFRKTSKYLAEKNFFQLKQLHILINKSIQIFLTLSQFSIKISTTTLPNLMSIIAATVSSSGRNKVGPKHIPRFEIVIKFLLDSFAILQKFTNYFKFEK